MTITPKVLLDSFMHLKKTAAAGVDGVTWHDYEEDLLTRIGALWEAVQSGRYRALPTQGGITSGVHPEGGRQVASAWPIA